MKHYQTSSELNNEIKQQQQTELKSLANIIPILLLTFGIGGCIMLYNDNGSSHIKADRSYETTSMRGEAKKVHTLPYLPIELHVAGDEAKDEIHFLVENMKKNATYFIRFGDGKRKKKLNDKHIKHIYTKPGVYHIDIIEQNDRKTEIVKSHKLDIGYPINIKGDYKETRH